MNLLQKQLLRYANSVCMTNIANDLVRCQERLEIRLSTYRPKYPSTYVEYPTRICVLVVVSLFVNCQGKSPRLLLRQVRLQLIHCLWFHAQSSKFCLPRWMCISSKDLCPETTSKIKKNKIRINEALLNPLNDSIMDRNEKETNSVWMLKHPRLRTKFRTSRTTTQETVKERHAKSG